MKRARFFALLAVLVLAGLLAFFSLRASAYLQYIPWMPRRLGVWADSHGIFRNTVAFFTLGLATFLLLGPRLLHVLAVAVFATAIEVAQIWIPSRAFDWRDIVASLAGIVVAWPLAWLVHRLRST